jgi:N-acetyl-anhydromuramyl-L-alanine amidase AmpD
MIDNKTYELQANNYIKNSKKKEVIVLGNTFNTDMKHFIGWETRYGGNYTKTAHYTVTREGKIYEHFKPEYSSTYLNDLFFNDRSIIILVENEGWVDTNNEQNEFLTWFGDIYKTTDNVVNKQWRNHYHWAPYTINQLNSVVELSRMLCSDFQIPRCVASSNTKMDSVDNYSGVLYKSNISGKYTDLSPAWLSEHFKFKLEKNEHELNK